jgi:radical SAM superfamily enzyme YgiQ (UPF0313 family)
VELQIGAESGSPRILDLIRKDITVDQIRESARLGQKHGIRILFSFMMGIPGETWADIRATLQLMDELRAVGDRIVTNGPFFYFPFPGTSLYELALEKGFRTPRRTKDWNFRMWGIHQPLAPFVDKKTRFIEHYRRLAWDTDRKYLGFPIAAGFLAQLARARWRKRFFRLPLDYHLPRFLLHLVRSLGLKKG